jgi:hypothetical protein
MAFIKDGGGTASLLRIEGDTLAARVALFPPNREGAYFIGEATGIVAAPAAAAEVFHLRNPSATVLVIIERMVIAMANAAAVTVAQEFGFDVIRATAWTADGTGGTALVPNKKRSSMPSSVIVSGNARVATTAALGAGTKTLDSVRLATGGGPPTNVIGAQGAAVEIEAQPGRDPVAVLAQNEGITVRNLIAYATGSARFHVYIAWRETLTAEWP